MKLEGKNNRKSQNKIGKILFAIGSVAVTVIGVMVIPPLTKKYGNKLYKKSLKEEKIDFENLGPEIITKEKAEEETEEEQ